MENLPDEILVNILKYLNTYDLVQFIEAYKNHEHLLRERKLIHRVNLQEAFQIYEIQVPKLICTRLDPNLIYSLNINGLYWIPTVDLIRMVSNLINLKELYAIDTRLVLYNNTSVYKNLSKLALTVTECNVESGTILNLKSFYLKIVLDKCTFNFQELFNEKWQLEELWVSNENKVLNYEIIPYILKDLKKFVIRSRSFSPFYDFSHCGLQMTFQCSRNESEIEFIYEKVPKLDRSVSLFEPIENQIEEAWDILHRHNKDLSCGPKEGKLLYLKENMRNIFFEELNFGHSIILCQSKYIEAALKILLSNNACDLQKLHLRSCLFQRRNRSQRKSFSDSDTSRKTLKKVRIDVATMSGEDPFENVAKSLRKLKELEIIFCSGCHSYELLSSYNSISWFENLEKLTLEVPLLLDGSFLKDVLIKCQQLWSLKLTLVSQNERFMLRLCENLKYANSLRDFKLNNVQFSIEKLLASFSQIASKKLQRVFIECDNIRYNSNIEFFDKFLISNPQLMFFFLVVHKNTIKENSDIQKILNEHKKGKPAKIFYIKKNYAFTGYFPVPTAHHDMVYDHTNVSVINFDEF